MCVCVCLYILLVLSNGYVAGNGLGYKIPIWTHGEGFFNDGDTKDTCVISIVIALKKLGPIVPYFAVATAGTCNVSFTRMDEILNGIDVMDHEGTVLGRSVSAGKLAVFKTVTTRSMFLPIIPLLLPTISMNALTSANVIVAGSPTGIAVNIVIITLAMSIALPCALAILPETMELDVSSLEPEFQDRLDTQGQPIKVVFASKGL